MNHILPVTTDLLPHVQQLLAPDYAVHYQLGRGGMAVVFAATRRSDAHPVAIKILPPHMALNANARHRFVREARLAAALIHPGIVPVHTAGTRGDLAFIEMALIQGETLGARLKRVHRLTIADAQVALAEIADALNYAHAAGVIHRDIKPDNILIDELSGRCILTDFGIARALNDDADLTHDNVALGTPNYMSPEQAFANPDIDGRADIYALGVVGFHLLTGRVPFTAPSTPELLIKHASEPPPSMLDIRPDIPLTMVAAIDGALEKKPAARWPSAAAFRDALGELPSTVAAAAANPGFTIRLIADDTRTYAPSVVRRIKYFQRRAIIFAVVAVAVGVVNMIADPSFPIFLFVAGLMVLELTRIAAPLYDEDVPIKDLFARPAPPRPAPVIDPRYLRDRAEIRRMIAALSEEERALMPDIDATVDALHARVQKNDADRASAIDAMHAIRLDLMRLRTARFEHGLDAFNTTLTMPVTISHSKLSTDSCSLTPLPLQL